MIKKQCAVQSRPHSPISDSPLSARDKTMFAVFKRSPAASVSDRSKVAVATEAMSHAATDSKVISSLAKQASVLGRESAEVRGAIDDTHKIATAQAQAVHALALQLQEVVKSQAGIANEAGLGLKAAAQVGDAVQAVSTEVGGIVQTLREVSDAAGQITQIALQTRLVAFNASVEAKRAGEAGRGFGVVADAVKDLAGKVESSSKEILGTVKRLDERIAGLAREISREGQHHQYGEQQSGAVHRALDQVVQGVNRIHSASEESRDVCGGLNNQMASIEAEMHRSTQAMSSALSRTETFLKIAEQLIETVAESGVETEDTPYIRAAQNAAQEIGQLLEEALRSGSISKADLFDDNYKSITGTNPAQHSSRAIDIADRLFPQVQEKVLSLSEKVVFCIAADRNGYIACHNKIYNSKQRVGDLAYNSVHCRNRRIFNDRTGLASARNQRPFLLQTYRRDMGAGNFVVMKEAAAPITVNGQHWGGLRLAFKF
jgi:methyl-accepting chemotaxis protein